MNTVPQRIPLLVRLRALGVVDDPSVLHIRIRRLPCRPPGRMPLEPAVVPDRVVNDAQTAGLLHGDAPGRAVAQAGAGDPVDVVVGLVPAATNNNIDVAEAVHLAVVVRALGPVGVVGRVRIRRDGVVHGRVSPAVGQAREGVLGPAVSPAAFVRHGDAGEDVLVRPGRKHVGRVLEEAPLVGLVEGPGVAVGVLGARERARRRHVDRPVEWLDIVSGVVKAARDGVAMALDAPDLSVVFRAFVVFPPVEIAIKDRCY